LNRKKKKEEAMKNLILRFVREEDGQDLIEYALLAAITSAPWSCRSLPPSQPLTESQAPTTS
jgi:hypothetical protein